MTTLTTDHPYDHGHPTALAVYCSDGRFTHSVEQLLRQLGHQRLDTLTIPGGPGLLDHKTSGYGDCDTITRAAEFLIRGHHITHVVLLAHRGCGYYGAKFSDLSAEQVEQRQLRDLRYAIAALRETHPRLEIDAFLAVPDGGHVRFDRIDPVEPGSPSIVPVEPGSPSIVPLEPGSPSIVPLEPGSSSTRPV